MKNNNKIILLFLCGATFTRLLHGHTNHNEDPHYEWFESIDVAVKEEGVYASSYRGMFKLNVVDYDPINDRYKVQCNCLNMPYIDPTEALSFPCEHPIEYGPHTYGTPSLDLYDSEYSALIENEEQEAN